MNIKKGDKVIVISGDDKGKKSEVLKVFPALNKVLVAGVNVKKAHKKARKNGQKGEIIEKTMPINATNVMVLEVATGKRSRIGKKLVGERYIRITKRGGNEI